MFRAGTIRFTKTFEYQDDLRGTNDFAGQVRLEGMVVGEDWSFKVTNPGVAKPDPVNVRTIHSDGDDGGYGDSEFGLTLLGHGVLELKMSSGVMLTGSRSAPDEVVFVGV
jgi:hypothetical protein